MKISFGPCVVSLALVTGGLVVGFAWAILFLELGRSDGLVRYPEAERLTPAAFRLHVGAVGQISERSVYYTADTWRHVLGWYARTFDLELDREPQIRGGCFDTADTAAWGILRQDISITLCLRNSGTMIVIHRTLNLHW
jgi:hypothetical protein